MKNSPFLLILTLCAISFSQHSAAQITKIVRFTLVDTVRGVPVAGAHVLLPEGKVTISDSQGRFSVSNLQTPSIIRISHTTYGIHEFPIKNVGNNSKIILHLSELSRQIDEVQVTGERLRILTKHEDFSITDIEFDHENLWMIILRNNQGSRAFLALANGYGDTLSTIPVKKNYQLTKDVFGYVHIETKDSVYQLYAAENNEIKLLYGEDKNLYYKLVTPYIESFNGQLVTCTINQRKQSAKVEYYKNGQNRPFLLTETVDSLEQIRREMERKGHGYSMWSDFRRSRYWKKNTKVAEICEETIQVPIFSLNDSLYVLNVPKDSLLQFSSEGKLSNKCHVTFHIDSLLWDIKYKKINFITDESTNTCYILDQSPGRFKLHQLNHHTGQIVKNIDLPNIPAISDVHIFHNAVYFLYFEKNHPYFVRLYRYQLRS